MASSLTSSSGYAFTHPTVIGLFVTTLITLPLFAIIERRAAEPILPLSLLTRAQPSMVLLGFVLSTASNFARVSVSSS